MRFYSGGANVDDFIDAVEILIEVGSTSVFERNQSDGGGRKGVNRVPIPDVEQRVNRAFERVPVRLPGRRPRDSQDRLARVGGDDRRSGPACSPAARMGGGRAKLPRGDAALARRRDRRRTDRGERSRRSGAEGDRGEGLDPEAASAVF